MRGNDRWLAGFLFGCTSSMGLKTCRKATKRVQGCGGNTPVTNKLNHGWHPLDVPLRGRILDGSADSPVPQDKRFRSSVAAVQNGKEFLGTERLGCAFCEECEVSQRSVSRFPLHKHETIGLGMLCYHLKCNPHLE